MNMQEVMCAISCGRKVRVEGKPMEMMTLVLFFNSLTIVPLLQPPVLVFLSYVPAECHATRMAMGQALAFSARSRG